MLAPFYDSLIVLCARSVGSLLEVWYPLHITVESETLPRRKEHVQALIPPNMKHIKRAQSDTKSNGIQLFPSPRFCQFDLQMYAEKKA